ncbi:MAG: helix-turn-helix transcriptional regulator, partial [Actinomycetota bacterium]|nr:helix-turn-helix transcriptional regulator [Actinomycetota bacterium]
MSVTGDKLAESGAALTRTDLMLLGILASRSMHGYEIAEYLSQPKMQAWVSLGRASIYYAFGRLEKHGYVTRHSERHGGKPERTVFSITETGRAAFVDALVDALGSSERLADEFDIALYFSNRLDPPRAQERVEQRLALLGDQAERLGAIASQADATGDGELRLVLEHRLAILRADIDFLVGYVQMLAGGARSVAVVSGSLADVSLTDVLLNLASAGRSGVFRVHTLGDTVDLCFDEGRLYGVLGTAGSSAEDSLRAAFTSTRGQYEFLPGDTLEGDATPISGLQAAILMGARDVADETLLERMLPSQETLLGVRDGYEREVIGVDLTSEERGLLSEIDGVRTLAEIARARGWTTRQTKVIAYPLWLTGWLVRVDSTKRDFVLAVARYVRRWSEAISLFAGEAGEERVFEDVDLASSAGGLTQFRDID